VIDLRHEIEQLVVPNLFAGRRFLDEGERAACLQPALVHVRE